MFDKHFDIIIGGGGASGLSLAYRLAGEEFGHLKIAIIEPTDKADNDRTWCTWLKGDHIFDDCASMFFKNVTVTSSGFSQVYDIDPYRYRMIESKTFYKKVLSKISEATNIEYFKTNIVSHSEMSDKVILNLDNKVTISCFKYFKCFIDFNIKNHTDIYVDQHFKGFFIKVDDDKFDVDTCTFMDFNIDQKGEVRFMYVLPTSTKTALVEVAIFSNQILMHNQYDEILKYYIKDNLKIEEYSIEDTEFGIIPMTTYNFHQKSTSKVIHLGSAGGAVKASTGFAFGRIQEQCDYIIQQLKKDEAINLGSLYSSRSIVNDRTMLYVLLNTSHSGAEFFLKLFQKNKIQDIFKFLDEKSNLLEDLKLMSTVNVNVFARAFIEVIFKGLK